MASASVSPFKFLTAAPAPASPHYGLLNWKPKAEKNPFLPELLLIMMFITAIEGNLGHLSFILISTPLQNVPVLAVRVTRQQDEETLYLLQPQQHDEALF